MAKADSTVVYKDIPELPGYRAGSDGTIWTAWRRKSLGGRNGTTIVIGDEWKLMTPGPCKSGHLRVCIRGRIYLVHRLVLEAFVGPRPVGTECCHNDGNPANNALHNLRWGTRKTNMGDRIRHGTIMRGETHYGAKLTDGAVRGIRLDHSSGVPLHRLTTKYKVSRQTVRDIVSGRGWKHVV